MEDKKVLKVIFNDIMLPDSNINEPASHGFFNYFIQQMPDLAEGTAIDNRAGIYFDFNEPIITNTVRHIIDLGVSVKETVLFDKKLDFSIYPNPSTHKNANFVKFNELTDGVCRIANLSGKTLWKTTFRTQKLELPKLPIPSGMYFIHIEDKEGLQETKKWIILD